MKIPCKNCITFPICKNQLYERMISDHEKVAMMSVVSVLCKKCYLLECSLTKQPVPGENKGGYLIGELLEVMKIFNGHRE